MQPRIIGFNMPAPYQNNGLILRRIMVRFSKEMRVNPV